jgi:membrane-associated phospholipid phosphatase
MSTDAVRLPRPRFSRRSLVGTGLAGASLLSLSAPRPGIAAPGGSLWPSLRRRQEAATSPLGWHTWYLIGPDELRPAAPGSPGDDEVEEIVGFQAATTDEMAAVIAKWGTGPVVLPWSALLRELHLEFAASGFRQGKNLALLHTAMHDAAVAAWDAQLAHARPSPAATDERISPPTGVDPAQPSFPSGHAAVAGAAAVVLAYLFPDAAEGRFDDLATEAADSRVWAGAAFRSDVAAGLALGQEIGQRAVARGKSDGSDARFDPATMPEGAGIWRPTPPVHVEVPVEPLGGAWKTWVLFGGDQFRPAPPPEYGGLAWQAELATVQEVVANASLEQTATARWWQSGDPLATAWAHDLILKAGLDLPQAARVLAYVSVGFADAVIAVWDAKFTWWTSRPITEDPDIVTAFPTPPYPAYPSGYSAVVGAGEMILGHFFPDAAGDLAVLSWEAACSRAWAGIHYMLDNEVGLSMGRQVGRLVTTLARADEGDT